MDIQRETCRDDDSAPMVRHVGGRTSLRTALQELAVPFDRPVLVVVGWAGARLSEECVDTLELMVRAIVPVLETEAAVVVTGGTDAGVMSVTGRVVRDLNANVPLVGVAPARKLLGVGAGQHPSDAIAAAPGHAILATEGDEWGSEATTLIQAAEVVAGKRQVVLLAVGGGEGTLRELRLASRRRWPGVLVTGLGGASETLAELLRSPCCAPRQLLAQQQELIESGLEASQGTRGACFAAGQDVDYAGPCVQSPAREGAAIARAVRWQLSDDRAVKEAWVRFAVADTAATRAKMPTHRLALLLLALAVATVWCSATAALVHSATYGSEQTREVLSLVLKGFATGLPLVAGGVLLCIDRRARTGPWIALRASAEGVLRAIYMFRVEDPASRNQAAVKLRKELKRFDELSSGRALIELSETDTVAGSWPPPSLWSRVPADDLLVGALTGQGYDKGRVQDQLHHYSVSARRLDRGATRAAAILFSLTGIAAVLLAMSWRWSFLASFAALATGVAASAVAWREFGQQDARADAMLNACIALRAVRSKWLALDDEEREGAGLKNFVADAEAILADEQNDWRSGLHQAHQTFLQGLRGR